MTDAGVDPIPREARAYQGLPAGLVTRAIAAVLDTAVVAAAMFAAYAVVAGTAFVLDPRGFRFPDGSVLLNLTAGLVLLVVYLAAAWSVTGRTYGCHVMGLRVVSRDGRRLRPVRALARAVLYGVFPVGLAWCAISRASRSLQDLLLGTRVVYDWTPGSPWRRAVADERPVESGL